MERMEATASTQMNTDTFNTTVTVTNFRSMISFWRTRHSKLMLVTASPWWTNMETRRPSWCEF